MESPHHEGTSMGPKSRWPQAASPRTPQEQALLRLWTVIYAPLMQIKKPIKVLGSGEMWGSSRGPFHPHSMWCSWDAPNGPGKSKQAVPQGGGNTLLQIPGFRSCLMGCFLGFFFWGGRGVGVRRLFFFFNKRFYPPLQNSLHSNQT